MDRRMIFGGVLCLVFAVVGHAAAQPGSAQVVGHSVLAIEGCGRDRASFGATLVADADGTWSAQDSNGQQFAGTWTAKGRSGRKADLSLDQGTEAAFVAGLATEITQFCELPPVAVSSATKKAFTLAVNRKATRVTLVLRYVLRGSADGRSGTARYRMKAKGPWTTATVPAAS